MSLFDLKDVRNNPHRSSFDMTSKRAFTAKAGELLPIYWTNVMPGDHFKIEPQWFTRTQPVQTSAYTRLREYFDFFFVPYRQLWKQAPQAMMQLQDQPTAAASSVSSVAVGATLPNFTLSELDSIFSETASSPTFGETKNALGYKRGDLATKLLRYLGYGNFRKAGYVNYGTTSPEDQFSQVYGQNVAVSAMPLLAYQKIYNDFFRNSQWENSAPYTFNVDYWKGIGTLGTAIGDQVRNHGTLIRTMFDIGYCNWNKDFITGVLPTSQLGEPASVYVSSNNGSTREGSITFPNKDLSAYIMLGNKLNSMPVTMATTDGRRTSVWASGAVDAATGGQTIVPHSKSAPGDGLLFDGESTLQMSSDMRDSTINLNYNGANGAIPASFAFEADTLQSSFTILALRQAEALQKWKEIAMAGDRTYRDQVYRHFGVSLPAELADTVKYIGGHASNLDISEVVNTNLADASSETQIRGKGVGTGSGRKFDFTAKEHGVIMCIYHCVPLLDYQTSGQHPQLLLTNVEDYPIPEFDNLGLQVVPSVQLTNTPDTQIAEKASYLGYGPRYYQWKGDVDRVFGAFETTYQDWTAPFTDEYLKTFIQATGTAYPLSYAFFKVDPSLLNRIFALEADGTWDTDQLLINANIDVKVSRNLSRIGLPY